MLVLFLACSPSHPAAWDALEDRGHRVWSAGGSRTYVVHQAPDGTREVYAGEAQKVGQSPLCPGITSCPDAPPEGSLVRVTATEAVFTHFEKQVSHGSTESRRIRLEIPGAESVWSPATIDAAIAATGANPLTVSLDVGRCMRQKLDFEVAKVLAWRMQGRDADGLAGELLESTAVECTR
ncbi:MAG: hypothetical protein KC656_29080 [Myxococcales bacterium]|nr:hypothetical protein [Myxococcales bacterium]MCB9694286.1 hypothetical protein [Alphaproteobacteria bacterium]